ncbi:MAG TPA: hypothetical protein VK176_07695 [Phycisphaerales bacterium]|nr:hypothetical protein [Phycisphaerales bacterium]
MSTIAALADAVAAHVTAGSFGQPVTAVRMYQPAFTLEDLNDLRVSVVPRTVQMTPVTRDSLAVEYVIDVGVQKKLPADGADAAIDELLALAEAIADHLRFQRLEGFPDAAWVGISHEPVVSSESLEQHRVFTSVLSVTYRERK